MRSGKVATYEGSMREWRPIKGDRRGAGRREGHRFKDGGGSPGAKKESSEKERRGTDLLYRVGIRVKA